MASTPLGESPNILSTLFHVLHRVAGYFIYGYSACTHPQLLFPIPAFRDISRAVLSLGSCVTRLVVGHSLLVCDRWSFVACPWRPLPTLCLSRFLPKPRSARYLTVPGKTRSCPQSVLYTTHLTKKTGLPPLVLALTLLQLLLPR